MSEFSPFMMREGKIIREQVKDHGGWVSTEATSETLPSI